MMFLPRTAPMQRDEAGAPLLVATRVSRRFGGVVALDDVDLSIRRGEIFGLIGPNGAGKTTFFNVLTGLERPDRGECRFDGQRLAPARPHLAVRHGISRTFQNIRLFGDASALENVMTGLHARLHAGLVASLFGHRTQRDEERRAHADALGWLAYVGLAEHAATRARNLSYGDQRRLEIARALAAAPTLLALDEPAAGMNATETLALRRLVERIRDAGTTVLIIEHDMKLVMQLCNRIAVLDSGRKIAEGTPDEIRCDERVIEAYLGRRHAHA